MSEKELREKIAKEFVNAIRQDDDALPVWECLTDAGKAAALKMAD